MDGHYSYSRLSGLTMSEKFDSSASDQAERLGKPVNQTKATLNMTQHNNHQTFEGVTYHPRSTQQIPDSRLAEMVNLSGVLPAIAQVLSRDGPFADPVFCSIFVFLASILSSSATSQYNGLITALARHNSLVPTSIPDIAIAHVHSSITQGSDTVQGGLATSFVFSHAQNQQTASQHPHAQDTTHPATAFHEPHPNTQHPITTPNLNYSPTPCSVPITAPSKPTKSPSEHHAIFGFFRAGLRNIAKTGSSQVDQRTTQVEQNPRSVPPASTLPDGKPPTSRLVFWFKWFGTGISSVALILGLCAIPFFLTCFRLLRSSPSCLKCGDVLERYQGLLASFSPNNLRLLQQAPAIIQSQHDEIANVKAAFQHAEVRAAQLESELKEVDQELDEERQFSRDLETSVAAAWNIVESEKRSRKGIQEKLDETTAHFWNLQLKLEDADRVNAELKGHIERLTELCEQKAAEHKRTLILLDEFSEADLTQEEEELKKLRKQLEDKVNELLLGQYEHHMVHLRLAEVQKTLDAVRQENQKLREELKTAKTMLLDVQPSSDSRRDELVREVKSLKEQVKDQEKELKAERLNLKKERKEMETLQQDLATAEDRLKLAEEAMEAKQVVPRPRTRSRHPRTSTDSAL